MAGLRTGRGRWKASIVEIVELSAAAGRWQRRFSHWYQLNCREQKAASNKNLERFAAQFPILKALYVREQRVVCGLRSGSAMYQFRTREQQRVYSVASLQSAPESQSTGEGTIYQN